MLASLSGLFKRTVPVAAAAGAGVACKAEGQKGCVPVHQLQSQLPACAEWWARSVLSVTAQSGHCCPLPRTCAVLRASCFDGLHPIGSQGPVQACAALTRERECRTYGAVERCRAAQTIH